MTAHRDRRPELAQFLRSRRHRIAPEDVGLPPGPRRRTPGLRREEVAQLAGVGLTWYTWLEQGRPINVSVQILNAIARTLRLDGTEREHLYRLAGVPTVAGPSDGDQIAPELQQILDRLAPLPAAIYNARYDVLAWNRTYAALYPVLASAGPGDCNALRYVLLEPECCRRVVNRDDELTSMVAQLRVAFGRHVGEPDWVEFVGELSAVSPVFARLWAQHAVAGPHAQIKILQRVADRELRYRSSSFAVGASAELRMVVYTPLTGEDHALLTRVTEGPPLPAPCDRHPAGFLNQPAGSDHRAAVPLG